MDGVESWFCPGSRSFSSEGDFDPGHVLLLDCTLSLVLRGFDRCTVFALPQVCPFAHLLLELRSIYIYNFIHHHNMVA